MSGSEFSEPPAPVFFLSYARARPTTPIIKPFEVNRHVQRFYTDLTAHVNELIFLPTGQDLGFMDMTMAGGELWESTLLQAAGTCQVFVCLLSARYLNGSKWCAMEWDTFSRRRIVRRSDGVAVATNTAILPVLWAAPLGPRVPDVVNAVNQFNPTGLPDESFGRLYLDNGVYGLLNQRRLRDAYESIVWKLAQRIQQIHAEYYVEPNVPSDTTGLYKSFARGNV